jgi:4-hydroxy-tetrahydrodipicolinate synthase
MPTNAPGAFVCTVTPFDEHDKVDTAAIREIFGRFIGSGVGAALGTASPGEGQALSLEETEVLYGTAKEVLSGRAPVRAMGREPRTAKQALEVIRIAESVGLDAMQLYSLDLGHGQKPSDVELEHYFRTLLENMTMPATLSSHMMSGYLIPVDMFARLLDAYPHLAGAIVTTPDLTYLARMIDVAKDRADIHVGGPQQAVTSLTMGAQGFLCTEGLIAPKLVGSVVEHFVAGDMEAMSAANNLMLRIGTVNAWPGGTTRFIKACMRTVGLPGHHIREPFLPLDESVDSQIREGLKRLAIPELESRL